ncbi:hypothetical protein Dda_3974 [Drechslerella dactyloides]|uniref:C3H1-type domain-containing protein n=1 Tax=Drechslerella dactyloides TaxID=74499 RepID=A0AAD6IYY8_DREDA|nr:hypothetical protein Dda_3974 [Drechslerella dactyloides]
MAAPSRAADEDFPVPLQQAPAEASAAASSSISQTSPQTRGQPRAQRPRKPCKFYATKAGCKNGDSCPFLHGDDRSAAQLPGTAQQASASDRHVRHAARGASGTDALATRRHLPTVDPSRVVRRPVPAGENTPEVRRQNEINQLKRRWGNVFQTVDQEQGVYRLELKQSEDFPYDLDALKIEISVPPGYPKTSADGPTVKVLNDDIPKGHQINIERGFSNLVKAASNTTRLLDLLNNLDKRLEDFLSSEKATTFKIVPNVAAITQETAKLDVNDHPAQEEFISVPAPPPVVQKQDPPRAAYSQAEKEAASARRAVETRQLEARFRQSNVFWKNAAGTTYKVPLEPRMKNLLPAGLLLVNFVDLKVPELYPLEPCRVAFDRRFPPALTSGIEKEFLKRAQEKPEVSLMAQLNYLAQNLHNMLGDEPEPEQTAPEAVTEDANTTTKDDIPEAGPSSAVAALLTAVPDKPHVIRVEGTRPPEWDNPNESESDSEDDDSEADQDDGDDEEGADDGKQDVQPEPVIPVSVPTVERGTSISFPDIKLKNIELLELKTINLTTKCSRCKTVADVNNLKAKENRHTRPKLLGCENRFGCGWANPTSGEPNTKIAKKDAASLEPRSAI